MDNNNQENPMIIKSALDTLIKYLNEEHHPHTKIIINSTGREIVEGVKSGSVTKFIKH